RAPTIFYVHATATPEIYTLSLHDALPICAWLGMSRKKQCVSWRIRCVVRARPWCGSPCGRLGVSPLTPGVNRPPACQISHLTWQDRKSTRLNSSHVSISYAVFCLKKKKKK